MSVRYAVVSYLDGELARFVAQWRGELEAAGAHLRPHITLMAPRVPKADLETLEPRFRAASAGLRPIDISFGDVQTFSPVSPTLYIAITIGADLVVRSSARLQSALGGEADFPYVPHLTLAQFVDPLQLQPAWARARAAWAEFRGARSIRLGHAVLVAESSANAWDDILRLEFAATSPKGS